ncbi:hypothetical protein [Alkalihalobacillus trypoxylicola]|uniref:Uncharacterized protein n=1 Tax=Alkalihalobacillus trypoxylicola TaxID=519424 RepID=A0A162D599_9BACI|nr:hypothetical protein [Alkalihalobacillus trypoxylicola]KYG28157.1 hypothetical protein AZF04_09645 [Alkalihalobacillus trypoxylicola]
MDKIKSAYIVCRENYKTNCHNCPVRPECVVEIGAGQEAHEKWVASVNGAAERYLSERENIS